MYQRGGKLVKKFLNINSQPYSQRYTLEEEEWEPLLCPPYHLAVVGDQLKCRGPLPTFEGPWAGWPIG